MRGVVDGIVTVAALEDLGPGSAGQVQRFGFQRVVVELVEVTLIGELVGRPYAFETFDELAAAAVALSVI